MEQGKTIKDYSKKELQTICKDVGVKYRQSDSKKVLWGILQDYYSKNYYEVEVLSETPVGVIYHLSDIHIRMKTERHEEYREVFERVYTYLRQEREERVGGGEDSAGGGVIVICGDLLHEKDIIRANALDLFREFLKTLSDIMPVLVISGNHDLNENNLGRMDSLKVMTDGIPIHYLRESGVYRMGQVYFGVCSLVGNCAFIKGTDIPIGSESESGTPIKVALYHGQLGGSRLDNGQPVQGDYKVGDFAGYDYVLLGDIHKQQFLTPRIAYCGSLIQQNHGESLTGHGLIRWDLATGEGRPVEIANNYGFITVRVVGGEYEIQAPATDLPAKVRVRYKVSNTSEELLAIARAKVAETADITVVSETTEYVNDAIAEIGEDYRQYVDDTEILREIAEPEQVDDLVRIHNEMKAQVEYNLEEMVEHTWSIRRITFRNVMKYGGGYTNVIDFTEKNGVVGIHGPNAIGKSSIYYIITFAIFDSIAANYRKVNVINNRATDMELKVEIEVGPKTYIIRKVGKRGKKSGKVDLRLEQSFYEIDADGREICLTEATHKDTIDRIRDTLGKRDDFILMNIVSHMVEKNILTYTDRDCMKQLQRLFRLEVYENLEKAAKDELKKIKGRLQELKGAIASVEKAMKGHNFKEGEIESKSRQVDQRKAAKEALQVEVRTLDEQLEINAKAANELNRDYDVSISKKKDFKKGEIKELRKQLDPEMERGDLLTMEKERLGLEAQLGARLPPLPPNTADANQLQTLIAELVKESDGWTGTDKLPEEIKKRLMEITHERKALKKELSNMSKVVGKTKATDSVESLRAKITEVPAKLKVDTGFGSEEELGVQMNLLNKMKKEGDVLQERMNELNTLHHTTKEIDEMIGWIAGSAKIELREADHARLVKMLQAYRDFEKTKRERSKVQKAFDEKSREVYDLVRQIEKNRENVAHNEKADQMAKHNAKIENKITALERDAINTQLKELKAEKEALNVELEGLEREAKIVELRTVLTQIQKNAEIRAKLEILEARIANERLYQRVEAYDGIAKKLKRNKEIEEQLSALKTEAAALATQRDAKQQEVDETTVKIQELEIERNVMQQRKREHDKRGDELAEYVRDREEVLRTEQLYRTYQKMVSKTGIPYQLLQSKLTHVQDDVNRFLVAFVGFQLQIECVDETINFVIVKDNAPLNYQQCSGFERFVLNIALKRSLNRFGFLCKSRLFVIDEGLDSIDSNHMRDFNKVMEFLKRDYSNILLISHLENMEQYEDNKIMIGTDGTFSKILS